MENTTYTRERILNRYKYERVLISASREFSLGKGLSEEKKNRYFDRKIQEDLDKVVHSQGELKVIYPTFASKGCQFITDCQFIIDFR